METQAQPAAEQRARAHIDEQLRAAGWAVVDRQGLNLFTPRGSAVREVIMKPDHGRADYLLYVDKQVVGVIEAKPQGTPLSGVEWQSAMYAAALPEAAQQRAVLAAGRLPFVFEANGSETHFTNGYDPHPRAMRFFGFPQPATLARWITEAQQDFGLPTWRAKVPQMPALLEAALRPAQVDAVKGVERSLGQQQYSVRWSRWRLELARRSPLSPSPTACSGTAASSGSCSWWTATTSATRRCGVPRLHDP